MKAERKKDIYGFHIYYPVPPLFPDTPAPVKKDPFQASTQSRAFGVIVSEHFIHIGENKSFLSRSVVVRHSWMVCSRSSFLREVVGCYVYMCGLDAQQNLDEMVVLFGDLFLLMVSRVLEGGGHPIMSIQVMTPSEDKYHRLQEPQRQAFR